METDVFESNIQKKRKQKRVRTIVIWAVVLIVLAAGAIALNKLLSQAQTVQAGILTYQVGQVLEGEISTSISGSGQLTARELKAYTSQAEATVETVSVTPGQQVAEGDALATLVSEAVQDELDALYDELDTLRTTIARSSQLRSSRYVTAPRAGVVKDLQVADGDNLEDCAYVCKISTDGRMKLVLETDAAVRLYDEVEVMVGEETVGGYVFSVSDGTVTVIIKDNSFLIGTAATAQTADGTSLGTGALELNEYITVLPEYGRILSVKVREGASVSKGAQLLFMDYDAPGAAYLDNKAAEAELLEKIADKEAALQLTAPFDALVTSVSVAAGDEVAAGDAIVTVLGLGGYTMPISVDELDIYDIAIGQDVSVTFDSVEGTFTGTVENIAYEGTAGGNVTTFPVWVALDYQPGTFPGSSAAANIITATSGQTLLVPVDAVQYESGNAFLYLAPADATLGASYDAALDLTTIEKVSVTTGMSDGSYIAVSGQIEASDAILVPKLTTTSTYTSDAADDTSATFAMGGMGGMGDMGGMSMPEGDFTRPDGTAGQRQQRPEN